MNILEYICTGSLISPRHVVTAAHCFADSNPETYIQEKCGDDNPQCLQHFIGDKPTERCKTNFLNTSTIIKTIKVGYGSHCLTCPEHPMEMLDLEAIDPSYIDFFHSGCYENDLAILTLSKNETDNDSNQFRRPFVCLSFATDINIYDGGVETLVLGWGKDRKFLDGYKG